MNNVLSMSMAANMGVQTPHMESAVQEVINLIVEDNNIEIPLMSPILDCKKFMLDFNKVKIQHIFRETNRATDVLANDAVGLEEHFFIHGNPPQKVYKNISFDSAKKTVPRLVQDCSG